MAKLSVILEKASLIDELAQAGADEVLIVLKDHSFHASAPFDEGEAEDTIRKIHHTGMEAGVIADRLFHEDETEAAASVLRRLLEKGADTVQIADPGLAVYLREYAGRLVYRPAQTVTSANDAAWWMKQGFASVYVSPLLTAEELQALVQKQNGLSVCIHGRQMMSVSARKLLSAYGEITGKQIPRSVFIREEKRDGRMPVFENAYCTTVWTDDIMHSFYVLPEIKDDIQRCEVCGLLCPDEELLDTVRVYRAILDGREAGIGKYLEKYKGLPVDEGYYRQKTIR